MRFCGSNFNQKKDRKVLSGMAHQRRSEIGADYHDVLIDAHENAADVVQQQQGVSLRDIIRFGEMDRLEDQRKALITAAEAKPEYVRVTPLLPLNAESVSIVTGLGEIDYSLTSIIPEYQIRRLKKGVKADVPLYLRHVENLYETIIKMDTPEESIEMPAVAEGCHSWLMTRKLADCERWPPNRGLTFILDKIKQQNLMNEYQVNHSFQTALNLEPVLVDEARHTAYSLQFKMGLAIKDRDWRKKDQEENLYTSVTVSSYANSLQQSSTGRAKIKQNYKFGTSMKVVASLICPQDGEILLISQIKTDGAFEFCSIKPCDANKVSELLPVKFDHVNLLKGWKININQDYFPGNKRVYKQNANSIVWWQNGKVLALMIQKRSKYAVALFHMGYESKSLSMIENVDVIALNRSQVPSPLTQSWPPLLIGHHKRFLIFRMQNLNFAALKCLYQRRRLIPKDAQNAEWTLIDGKSAISRMYQVQSDPMPIEFQSFWVSSGGQLITKCIEITKLTQNVNKHQVDYTRHRLFLKMPIVDNL